jgi:hypothetical protein
MAHTHPNAAGPSADSSQTSPPTSAPDSDPTDPPRRGMRTTTLLIVILAPLYTACLVALIGLWPNGPALRAPGTTQTYAGVSFADGTVTRVEDQTCPGDASNRLPDGSIPATVDCPSVATKLTSGPDRGRTVTLGIPIEVFRSGISAGAHLHVARYPAQPGTGPLLRLVRLRPSPATDRGRGRLLNPARPSRAGACLRHHRLLRPARARARRERHLGRRGQRQQIVSSSLRTGVDQGSRSLRAHVRSRPGARARAADRPGSTSSTFIWFRHASDAHCRWDRLEQIAPTSLSALGMMSVSGDRSCQGEVACPEVGRGKRDGCGRHDGAVADELAERDLLPGLGGDGEDDDVCAGPDGGGVASEVGAEGERPPQRVGGT